MNVKEMKRKNLTSELLIFHYYRLQSFLFVSSWKQKNKK